MMNRTMFQWTWSSCCISKPIRLYCLRCCFDLIGPAFVDICTCTTSNKHIWLPPPSPIYVRQLQLIYMTHPQHACTHTYTHMRMRTQTYLASTSTSTTTTHTHSSKSSQTMRQKRVLVQRNKTMEESKWLISPNMSKTTRGFDYFPNKGRRFGRETDQHLWYQE